MNGILAHLCCEIGTYYWGCNFRNWDDRTEISKSYRYLHYCNFFATPLTFLFYSKINLCTLTENRGSYNTAYYTNLLALCFNIHAQIASEARSLFCFFKSIFAMTFLHFFAAVQKIDCKSFTEKRLPKRGRYRRSDKHCMYWRIK